MAKTIVGLNDPKAVRKYSAFLAVDVGRTSYFNRKFMGVGVESQAPIQTLPHLENDSGDTIAYDLVMQLRMQPVEGDDTLEGREEDLKFYTDSVTIDQARGGVNTGGRMTRKRTIHDLRKVARARQAEWWARVFDELFFMYLSGARGVNSDFIYSTSYAGFANNPLVVPDTYHILYQNGKTKSTIAAVTNGLGGDGFTVDAIDQAKSRAEVMGGGTSGIPAIEPIMIEGEEHYVCVMHPFQEFCLRKTAGTGQWLDIHKAAAAAEGRNNPIFKGSLGMYNNVVLHCHKGVIRFNDYGAGSVQAARALFLGRQAGVVAFGSPGTDLRFDWHEESRDNGNQAVITTSSIFGIKKTSFDTKTATGKLDFGVLALDSAIGDPSNAGL
jgi:N4-gp56 family major capsid protein